MYSCCCSVFQSCLTLCKHMDCSSPCFPVLTVSQGLLKLMSIDSVKPSNNLIICCPLLLLPSVFCKIRVCSNGSASGDQSIGASVSASVLLMNFHSWFPLGWTGLISLMSKGLSGVLSNATSLYRNLQILPSAKPSKSKLWTGHLTSHSPTQPNTITALLELNNSIQYLSHTQMAPLVPDNFLIAFLRKKLLSKNCK